MPAPSNTPDLIALIRRSGLVEAPSSTSSWPTPTPT